MICREIPSRGLAGSLCLWQGSSKAASWGASRSLWSRSSCRSLQRSLNCIQWPFITATSNRPTCSRWAAACLVKYPTRKDITPEWKDVGPKFTMAPEMRRQASKAEGAPADVYSFAKTLWIGLTGQRLAFDGQYLAETSLGLRRYHPGVFSTPLDELLTECTDTDPKMRPAMRAVAQRLAEWIELENDFHRRNLREWVEVQNRLFPKGSPSQATWSGIDEICSVLRLVADTPSLNHMFFPDGGGLTIEGISLAAEPGFIVFITVQEQL